MVIMCNVIETQKLIEDAGLKTAYGIIHKKDNDSLTMENISCNYQFVCDLAKKMARNKASAVHFFDIIDDELAM